MKYTILFAVLTVYLFAQGRAQTCPGGGSCNCQLNNVESLRALVRSEVQTQVQQEVVRRLANISSKACGNVQYGVPLNLNFLLGGCRALFNFQCIAGTTNCMAR